MAEPLTVARTAELRRTPGATALLYLTDRCPVGCAHCSVAARPDSPAPRDPALLEELLAGLCGRDGLRVVAVSGGEPFTERRALTRAVRRLSGAGLAVVVFTSGNWARPGPAPAWTAAILARVATVFLGTDAQHTERLGTDRLRQAIGSVVSAGCHLVLQVIGTPGNLAMAHQALADELGPGWPELAEVHRTEPLATGRAERLFAAAPARPAAQFGPCLPARAPTIRYDGTVTGCCNEAVITGHGPAALRRTAADRAALSDALDAFRADGLLRLIAARGPGALVGVPGFERLGEEAYRTVCDACWAAHGIAAAEPRAAVLAGLLAGGPS